VTTPFYAPPDAFTDDRVVLPPDEARHAVKVLRHAPGDEVVVIDGVGGWHRVRLEQVGQAKATGRVLSTRTDIGEPPYALTIACGLLKQRSRYETFLEKAVELGAARIIPLHTSRTERLGLKAARAENILLAATKQCGRSRVPVLDAPTPLADALADLGAAPGTPALRLIAHEAVSRPDLTPRSAAAWDTAEAMTPARRRSMRTGMILRALAMHREAYGVPAQVTMLVGPEGGFTDDELVAAVQVGFAPVGLGPRRLRTETAAVTACAAVAIAFDMG
jgi:16S rRNA (uracil1498-N3)-methyltransferase